MSSIRKAVVDDVVADRRRRIPTTRSRPTRGSRARWVRCCSWRSPPKVRRCVLHVRGVLSAHVFIGMLLVPPVLVKLASTGYRIVGYYGGDPRFVARGAPPMLLRMLGPVVALTTVALIATGVLDLVLGTVRPARRAAQAQLHRVVRGHDRPRARPPGRDPEVGTRRLGTSDQEAPGGLEPAAPGGRHARRRRAARLVVVELDRVGLDRLSGGSGIRRPRHAGREVAGERLGRLRLSLDGSNGGPATGAN